MEGSRVKLKIVMRPVFILLLAISFFIAGCQGVTPPSATEPPPSGGETPPSGGETPAPGGKDEPAPQGDPKATPRNETLYVNGLQWGAPTNFNLLSGNAAFPINYGNSRELVYETLFMVNQLTGELEPLLGTKYEWTDDLNMKVELHPEAKWSDGKPFTSEDVVYTYQLGKKYDINWSSFWTYIADVKADGPHAVIITLNEKIPTS